MNNPSNQKTVVSASPYIELERNGEIRQFTLIKDQHRLGRDAQWSDLNVPTDWTIVSSRHAILRREGEDYRIYDGDDNKKPSTNGIFINKTRITCSQGYLLSDGILLEIGQDPRNYLKLVYINPNLRIGQKAKPSKQQLSLKNLQQWPVELGRDPRQNYASIQLDSPVVSRIHATIFPAPQGGYLIKDCSTNGTFINGQRLVQPTLLKEKDIIKIGPFTLIFQADKIEVFDRGQQIRLDAYQLYRKVKDQKGKTKVILNNLSLPIEPGQLVALVGGSGAGKSTLLKTLLGIEPIDTGKVLLNDKELRENFHLYRTQIGYVPQDDIVHQDLTVEEVLIYACKLRLPPETDVEQALKRVISQVKLDSVKDNLVRQLSGGQRKRVSIAVELLADPRLFFLDEPTSGLDPGLDKEIMKLLRELADQGRTIILVTHATANIEVCDQIVFLGRGGNLCYLGQPKEAMTFFNMPSQDLKYFADIYLELDRGKTTEEVIQNVLKWANKFLNTSPLYQSYQQVINARSANNNANPDPQTFPKKNLSFSLIFSQLNWLSRRYIKLISREIRSLILALATAPISIFLITLTLKEKDPLIQLDPPELSQAPLALKVLFIFTCAALWVGLSSSVQEVVKEFSIYARERLINLSLFSYLGSKILIRSALALLQTILMSMVILFGFKAPDSELLPWSIGLGITTFLTIFSSLSLGLMISTFVKNETEANNTLPLILLPQIIFSGVLFQLEGLSSKISWLMISRWSIGAYGTLVKVNDMVPEAVSNPLGNVIERPFEPTPIYDHTWQNLSLNWLILCLHSLIYLGLALWSLKSKDKVS